MAAELSGVEYHELLQILQQKLGPGSGNCHACGGQSTVQLAAHLVTPIATTPTGGIQLQAANYPQAMLLCQNCGHTTYFNYVILKQNG